jgi:A/G-specific adenine glycosylase
MDSVPAFRRTLLAWYGKHRRDLPWRHTRDPYAILVSEIMLQQTQVATVIPYYNRWLRRFPDFGSLASASESDVLHAWQGLGYYARARNLHATAKAIVSEHGGIFPASVERIRTLPGLGRYTANAVLTFAFGRAVPVVEANIARLLARVMNLQEPIDSASGREQLWKSAAALVPARNATQFNSALMDLGATICTARQPKCEACVVRSFCRATDAAMLPIKKERAALRLLTEQHAFVHEGGHLLLEQSQRRWRGMWILPRLNDVNARETPLYTAEFPFTHHRITLAVYKRSHLLSSPGTKWFSLGDIASIPLPSPHRRALAFLTKRSNVVAHARTRHAA